MPRFRLSRSALVIMIQLFILFLLTLSLCIKSRQAAAESFLPSGESPETQAEASEKEKDYIHWVDFDVTAQAMEQAFRYDMETCQADIHLDWIDLLAFLGARYGGDFSRFQAKDLDTLAERLKNGETIEELTKDMKYFSYYHEAYSAVLGGMVGYFRQEIDDPGWGSLSGQGQTKGQAQAQKVQQSQETTPGKIWVTKYGLRAFSPIAKGFPYNDYDDFGVARSYGYKRQHLGHDMMGQVGTPIIAVESGYVEAIGWNQYGGWRIGIRSFDKKRYYYYAHLRQNYPYQSSLSEGSVVTAGDVIGYLGRTGYSATENTNNISTPHLHFGLQLIFDESQKEGNNEIWVNCYELVKFLHMNQCQVVKVEGTKEWTRVYEQEEDGQPEKRDQQ
ncbi:MAG: M23 family metallopeptidase [Lachnospiraceae bacterium]|jgi:murein DD-endopeptidase MepM/ murein hydrolase activator NlpD|nr:M23 family metallopeptidase [Lachnospiraceae bacterium]